MKRKMVLFLIFALCLVLLVGCGGDKARSEAPKTESIEESVAEPPVEEPKKEFIPTPPAELPAEKPVIYLYPETPTTVSVRLALEGELIRSYPRYEDGWTVTAEPDGTLTDAAGQQYSYLYWEGVSNAEYDLSRGFCVPGEKTAAFLETALEQLGLTRREANEFIVYWLPKMEANEWNLISFQTEAYTDWAVLNVTPVPDTVLRVFMVWRGLDAPVEIEEQTLTAPTREGFTLVEWGGTELSAAIRP